MNMASGKHIRAVGQNGETKAQSKINASAEADDASDGVDFSDAIEPDDELDLAYYDMAIEEEVAPPPSGLNKLAPAMAILAVLGWSGFYAWGLQAEILSGATSASAWAQFIIDWSVPVLLVGVVWLLVMRNSRIEANRFAKSAALLSQESRELEGRLTVVNRELSLAREFLGAQSRELESLGRVASERISTHADTLQTLIKDNGAQVDAIGSASDSALANMNRLRDDLPVVANSARDVSNQVAAAGRGAHEQLDKLVSGFERLNQFGKASEKQVTSLDSRVSDILGRFQDQLDRIEASAGERLEEVQGQTQEYRSEVEQAESGALQILKERVGLLQTETKTISAQLRHAEQAAMEKLGSSKDRFGEEIVKVIEYLDEVDAKAIGLAQSRVDDLNSKVSLFEAQLDTRDRQFNEQVARVQAEFSTNEAQASEVLSQRLADLDDALAKRREAQTAETEKLVANSVTMNEQIEELTALTKAAEEQGETTRQVLAEGLDKLDSQLEEKRETLRKTETDIAELTEAGVRLLEIIQSSAQFTREDLPEAMQSTLGALGDVESRAEEISTLMLVTNERAEDLSKHLIEARQKVDENDEGLETLQAKVAEQSEDALAKVKGLQSAFTKLAKQSEGLASETQESLRGGLMKLEEATRDVFETLDSGARDKVDALAASLSERAVSELERSLRNNSAEAVGKLEQAAAHASGVGREATAHLRDQLTKVNELTVNLEQRIARARELAEEQVNNDFSRRMALITDSLNSSAIDLTSALAQEVSDTSWDAYLKGDRGIFTRRAVRLIDSGEAREIAELYQNDEDFKANVSRYIHDFESMLRSVLSTRDGKALGVTVLGSDVGKLYVVLAQAIERLRQ